MINSSSIARPYYEALFSSINKEDSEFWDSLLERMTLILSDEKFRDLYLRRVLNEHQLFELFVSFFDFDLPEKAKNFIKILITQDRLLLIPDISNGLKFMRNQSENKSDILIKSAFELTTEQIEDLLLILEKKFKLKLHPKILIDKSLIGGIRIILQDTIIDASVQNYLRHMQAKLLS